MPKQNFLKPTYLKKLHLEAIWDKQSTYQVSLCFDSSFIKCLQDLG